MIVRSLVVTCILLAGYALFVSKHRNIKQQGQYQLQDNLIRGQQYIYSANKEKLKVIIGSSLSCRLVMDSLPVEYYNLAFGGQSLFEGLYVILHTEPKPKEVYIEMNMIKRPANTNFVSGLFIPLVSKIEEDIPILQEKNQPLTFLGNYVRPGAGTRIIDPFTNKIFNPLLNIWKENKKSESNMANGFENKMIQKEVKDYSIPFEDEVIRKQFVNLKDEVLKLTDGNVKIVFFEMPMNPAIENSAQMKSERELFKEYFPSSQFRYLPKPDYAEYNTTDGFHLAGEDALKFTKYFLKYAK